MRSQDTLVIVEYYTCWKDLDFSITKQGHFQNGLLKFLFEAGLMTYLMSAFTKYIDHSCMHILLAVIK